MLGRERIEATVHYSAALVGGYFGIYALMVRSNNFGSSQTSNLIYIVSSILGNSISELMIRVGAALLYMVAIFLTVLIPKHFSKVNMKLLSMCVNAVAVVILAFLPMDMDPILGLYPIFFAMAFQWNSFNGARGYNSSTIFSTNNLRQLTMSFAEVVSGNCKQLDKLKFYGATLIGFHIGVAVSYVAWYFLGISGIWFGLLPIVLNCCLVCKEIAYNSETYYSDKDLTIYTKKTA